jgi:lipid-A-disaccharide synthase
MLVIFPFEERFYKARGVDAEFVGHPLARLGMPSSSREEFVARCMTGGSAHPEKSSHMDRTWVAMLPGSRWKEMTANLPVMLEAAALLGPGYDFLIPVANTLDKRKVSDLVLKEILPRLRWPASSITLVDDARGALFHARASVVASGTATVQALTIGNPFVVVYRVSKLTFAVVKRMVRYPAEIPAEVDADGNLPVGMVNLIAGKRIVPELLNERFTAENLAEALRPLLADGPERERMIADLAEARGRLLPEPGSDPIARVCDAVEGLLGGRGVRP